MHRFLFVLLAMCITGSIAAEIPPLEVQRGEMVENIACFSDPTQTYTIYVPSTYTSGRRLPVLLVFDPRGRSLLAAELFRDAAEAYGWIIVSSDNTRSDTSWEPIVLALQALWPEVHTRIPADFDRIYAAGFSGCAAAALLLVKNTEQVAGIIACGGRVAGEEFEDSDVAVFSVAGTTDFNFVETHRLDEFLAGRDNPNRLAIFEGTHSWMPSSVAREAVEWFEILAMRAGTRNRDPDMIESSYKADLEKARSMAADGEFIGAVRRLREMGFTYAGLHDTSEATKSADRIESTAEYRIQQKRVNKMRRYEDRCRERRNAEFSLFEASEFPPPTQELAGKLYIRNLKQHTERHDEEGLAAQRCLNDLYVMLSFYLPRDDLQQGRYLHVARSYELANMIRDDNPVVWYNLACVRARLGQGGAAVEALRNALNHGFKSFELLQTDSDLDSLRDREDFKALLAEIPGF